MIDVHSKALDSKILINRILGKIKGKKPGPTVVFFGGIHGNETAGVFALHDALKQIKAKNVKGIIYGITGNLAALRVNQRYVDEDLNRLWTKDRIDLIHKKENLNTEEKELLEIEKILNKILQTESPPYYFIDLHTTSSKTLPFITINDALINRKFSKQYPVPIILGIEEYLNGPLLSYVNTMGYVSLGFESGQHDELRAVTNTSAFINLTLLFADVLCKTTIEYSVKSFAQLQTQSLNIRDVFEVVYLHRVRAHETFSMNNEFKSFQRVSKGTPLATNNNEIVKAKFTSLIFMPLYQKQGAEGFFLIKPIKPFFLSLSNFLRRTKFDTLLVLLPGISWYNKEKYVLRVNLKIARFFAKSFFHLLGYRNKQIFPPYMLLYNRERLAKTGMYTNENWF